MNVKLLISDLKKFIYIMCNYKQNTNIYPICFIFFHLHNNNFFMKHRKMTLNESTCHKKRAGLS